MAPQLKAIKGENPLTNGRSLIVDLSFVEPWFQWIVFNSLTVCEVVYIGLGVYFIVFSLLAINNSNKAINQVTDKAWIKTVRSKPLKCMRSPTIKVTTYVLTGQKSKYTVK